MWLSWVMYMYQHKQTVATNQLENVAILFSKYMLAYPDDMIGGTKPTPNPETPKKHRVYTNLFEKFARTFAFFPVTRVTYDPTEIVQKNLFRCTFLFWVEFSGGLSSCEWWRRIIPNTFCYIVLCTSVRGSSICKEEEDSCQRAKVCLWRTHHWTRAAGPNLSCRC